VPDSLFRPTPFALAVAALCLQASPGQAQTAEPAVLEPVVVTGSIGARRVADAPYSITVIDASELRSGGPMVNLSEALSRAPGLTVANRNNYAQDLQISSRGFGARAGFGVRGLRLLTDGIPATMPDGQGQVTHFDIAGAQRIEVLRGPFSALYGNSSGGVIALFTAAATQRRIGLDVDIGSFGMRQERISFATPLGNGWDMKAQFSRLDVDGFRPQSEARRNLGNVRLGWAGERDRIVLLVSDITQVANDPLGLTRPQIDADPDQTNSAATQFNTRKTARQTQFGGRWVHGFDGLGALSESAVTLYRGTRGVTQWQAIPVSTQTTGAGATRSGGGVVDFDRVYQGFDARLTWRWERLELVTGMAVEAAVDDRQGYENFTGTGSAQKLGVTGRLRRDEVNKVQTQDLFAQAEAALTTDVSATLGVRSGRVKYEAIDRFLSNGNDSGALKFSYTTPVLGLRWKPSAKWTLHASAARGFESPTLGELAYQPSGAAGLNLALQPQTSRQAELGARFSETGYAAQAALFQIDTDNEIGVATNSGGRSSFQNVGRTQRKGLEVGVQATLLPALKAQLALTWLDANYRDNFKTCTAAPCTLTSANNTATVPAGNKIAGTARSSAFGELAWQPWREQPTTLAVEWRAQGKMPVNDLNGDFAGGWGEAALRVSHRWKFGSAAATPGDAGAVLELLARVDNLTNRRHVGSVIVNDGNGRFFEPAAPRSGLLSLRYGYGW